MEEKNIVKWLNKTIASLQESHLQHDQDVLSIPRFVYPPEVGQFPNSFSQDYLQQQRDARIKSIDAAFDKLPQLEKICRDWNNNVLDSCFKKFIFNKSSLDSEDFEIRENYFMSLIHLSGHNLSYLSVQGYPYSRMMQFIKINCPNLELLYLVFKEVKSEDFKNVFSNMSHLKLLTIVWQCEDSTLPETLVKSLEQVGATLEYFLLQCFPKKNQVYLPYSLALVFPRLIALNKLKIIGFRVVHPLLQSIGKIKNLKELSLESELLNSFEYVCPVGLFKNLRSLCIDDDNVTDEFFIYLCNNAEKLEHLCISGTNITDNGIIALNILKELKIVNLNCSCKLIPETKKKVFITDKSIQYLFNKKLVNLNLSNCTEITNRSVIKLAEHLPNLNWLFIANTKATYDVVEEISKLKYREKPLHIFKSFKDRDNSCDLLKESHNVIFFTYAIDT